MDAKRKAAWREAVFQAATAHLRYAHYTPGVGGVEQRKDVDDNLGGDPVEEVVVGDAFGGTVWIGIPGIASVALREQLVGFLRALLPDGTRPATLAEREAALEAAGPRAYTIEIDTKFAQLMSGVVAIVDLVEAPGEP